MANDFMPEAECLPEIAYYYPNPYWRDVDWAKNILLFFDGIAQLIPEYMDDYASDDDMAVIEGLKEHNLFHVLRPEKVVDKAVAEELTNILDTTIRSGMFDHLAEDNSPFASISGSRLGFGGDHELAQIIVDDLKARGLAKNSEDGKSVPIHWVVRTTILVLLAQILRKKGPSLGFEFSPITDQPRLVSALSGFLNYPQFPTAGHVISFDLKQVGIDLGDIPIDEILAFREEKRPQYRAYMLTIKNFTRELGMMEEAERLLAFRERQDRLDEMGAALLRSIQGTWHKPASFLLGLTGTAAGVASSAIGLQTGGASGTAAATAGVLATAGGLTRILGILAGGISGEQTPDLGPFSYLFQAERTFRT